MNDSMGGEKEYQVIYVDPPWPQAKGGLRNTRPNQTRDLDYNTLPLSVIESIIREWPKQTPHVIFLWTIDKFLVAAEHMFRDYALHARIIWDKENGVAPAFTVRYSHEYLLWLNTKPMLKIHESQRGKWKTVIREASTKHSRKPWVARRMIESLYPTESKIELFARERFDGWDSWGDELEVRLGTERRQP